MSLAWWERAKRSGCRRGCLQVLLILGFFVIALTVAGILGVRQGLEERARLQREEALRHYETGMNYLREEQLELAIAEFELAMRLDPQLSKAEEARKEAEARLKAQVTPTSEVRSKAAEALWNQAQALAEEGQWAEAAATLERLRSLDPYYKLEAVSHLLFEAYYRHGLQLLAENRFEEAIRNFDWALELDPDAKHVQEERQLASLYLTALDSWGAHWERAIQSLMQVYQRRPDYKDVRERLWQAYVNYGDVYASHEDWCNAAHQYAMAVKVRPDEESEEKRIEAMRRCQMGTPTPSQASATPTPLAPIAGFDKGKLALPLYNPQAGRFDLFVVYPEGLRWVKLLEGASQPAFDLSGTLLAFRNEEGLGLLNLAEGSSRVLTSTSGLHPTWSPDGSQLAFAVKDEEQWRIYVISLNDPDQAREVASGWSPAWGPQGVFAYTGCDDQGQNCGIYLMGEGMAHPMRLTADPHDIGLAWSPDGREIAYMSDHDGNWEVYVVTAEGGQVRRLTFDPANDGLPTWSPDGRLLAFVSDRDGTWGVYLMNPDGSEQRKILDLGSEFPHWLDQGISWSR